MRAKWTIDEKLAFAVWHEVLITSKGYLQEIIDELRESRHRWLAGC